MGGFGSKYFDKCKISITVEQRSISAGETLTGIIQINLQQPYLTRALKLQLVGKERCYWESGSGSDKYRVNHKKVILDFTQVVEHFELKKLEAGNHSFPFELKIPDNAQPSFYYGDNDTFSDKDFYRIYYQLRAVMEFDKDSGAKDVLKPCFGQTKLMIINGAHRMPKAEIKLSVKNNISKFMLGNAGDIIVTVTFERDVYAPQEVATLYVNVDTIKCQKGIEGISYALRRRIKAKGHVYCACNTYEAALDDKYVVVNYPIKQAAGTVQQYTFNMPLLNQTFTSKQSQFLIGKGKSDEATILAPLYAPSVDSENLKCSYALEVTIDPDGVNMGSDLIPVSLPITFQRSLPNYSQASHNAQQFQ